jgi:uncharacterized protein YdeI (YjbR/CyaY-like superfamily)
VTSATPDASLLEPQDRAELRAWLEANHATSSGVRLAIGKKGNTVTALTYDEAVEEGLCFGWIDSTARRLDADRYTVLFTPRRRGSVWARSNKERVERLTAAGLMTPAGVAAVESAKADGSWDLLTDVDDLVVPPELAAALVSEGASARFDALPVSAKRIALYWIASAKRQETRARRIAETAAAAAAGRPPPGGDPPPSTAHAPPTARTPILRRSARGRPAEAGSHLPGGRIGTSERPPMRAARRDRLRLLRPADG